MPKVYGLVTRVKAAIQQDSAQVAQRLSGRGDSYIVQIGDSHNALSDEGSYYKAVSPFVTTAGSGPSWTAITGYHTTSASAFTSVNPVFIIQNKQPVGGNSVFMDYIRLHVTYLAANTAFAASISTGSSLATSVQCAAVLDSSNRYVSGGNTISVTNSNANSQNISTTNLLFGNVGASVGAANANKLTASSVVTTARTVLRTTFKSASAGSSVSPIPAAGDTYTVDFGDHISSFNSFGTTAGIKCFTAATGPVVIGPGHCLLFYLWYPGYGTQTNPVPIEFEIAWWER
jgi:hypothetical protein